MNTPWGQSDNETKLMAGIVDVSTPGHGGIGITREAAAQLLTPAARSIGEKMGGYLWYEEDCAWAVLVCEIPQLAECMYGEADFIRKTARATLTHYYKPYLWSRGICTWTKEELAAEIRKEEIGISAMSASYAHQWQLERIVPLQKILREMEVKEKQLQLF